MGAPTAAVDICNLALDHVGDLPISSVETPGDARSEVLARWYDQTRRTVLREYCWNFAQKYVVLARAGDGEGPHEDKYLMPADCVRINVVGTDIDCPITDFDISGRYIHTSNGDSLAIRYNRDIEQVSQMDVLFINILALRLAVKIAYKQSKKKSVVEMIEGMLAREEGKAISVDGQERPPRRVQHSKYLAARGFGGGGWNGGNRYYTIT